MRTRTRRHSGRLARATTLLALLLLAGCEPEIGSDAWCEKLAEKPKGDWSLNEATEFARSCVLKTYE